MNFLHTFEPQRILISIGPINIYWYGFFIVLGILAGLSIVLTLAPHYKIKKDDVIDAAFWIIIGGVIGARIYDVFLSFPYYQKYPIDAFKIWQGGLAIHGGIIAGLLILCLFAKKRKINFWLLTFLTSAGLALGQAIGRWGNYFNQELFGKPTDLPWGIPINIANRPLDYISSQYFQPTFLYESLGDLAIFLILISAHIYIIKKKKFNNFNYLSGTACYLVLYSLLRFSLEFIRIDKTPEIFRWRLPQIASIILIILALSALLLLKFKKYDNLNQGSHTN